MSDWLILLPDGQRTLKYVRDRLYREDRLTGDQMRDLAQALEAVLRDTIPYREEK